MVRAKFLNRVFLKRQALLALAVLASFFLNGCGQDREKVDKYVTQGVFNNEIVLGSSSALGGQASFLGTQTVHGSLAFINEINAKGGINGRKINLITYDDQYDPPRTVINTQKLINFDKVFALFDYVGTPTTAKIIDLVHSAQIPLLGLFTGAEIFRVPLRPYIFNVRDSYYAEAEGAISYFVDKLGLKNIAVMYQQDDFGLAVLSGVQLALQRRNLEPVTTDTFKRGTMDIEVAVHRIMLKGADVVIMVGTYRPLAKFIKVCHDQGFKPYFHTVSFVGSEAFAKELVDVQKIDPSLYQKIIVTQVVPSPFSTDWPLVKEYRELSKKYFPEDPYSYVGLEGFMNAKVLSIALEKAGRDLTRENFIEALESLRDVDIGIGKDVTYSVMDHQGLSGIYYSRLNKEGFFEDFSV